MSKNRNVGKEIKKLAEAIMLVVYIPCLLTALIVFLLSFGSIQSNTVMSLLGMAIGVGIGFVGYHVARIMTLKIYGFGELVEQTMLTHYAVCDLKKVFCEKFDIPYTEDSRKETDPLEKT